jgi:hypothetical protein
MSGLEGVFRASVGFHRGRKPADFEGEDMMKTLKVCLLFVCLLALPSLASAQSSVNGSWSGEVQGGRGPQTISMNLKADGEKLTGALTGGRGDIPLEDGSISGATLKFKTKLPGRNGGADVMMTWTGTLKGDEIAFSRVAEGGQGQAQEFVVKRQK